MADAVAEEVEIVTSNDVENDDVTADSPNETTAIAEDPSSKNTANGHEDIAQLKTAFALQEEINATRQRDLTNSNKELKARVACLVSDLEVRCRELDESRRQYAIQSEEAETRHNRATDDLRQVRQSVAAKEELSNKERDEWEVERNAFRDQLAKLRKEMESQKSEHEKALISSHADLQLQLSEARRQTEEAEAKLPTLQEQLAGKEEERLAAVAEKSKAERLAQQFRQEAEKAKSVVQTLEADVNKWQMNYESVQTLLNDTQKQTDKGKDDVKSQYIKLSWAQNKLKAETEAHKESKKKLEDTSKQLATVQQEMDKLQKEHDKTVTEVQDRSLRSSTQLDGRIKELETDVKKVAEELKVEHEAHSVTAKQLLEVQGKLKDAEAAVAELTTSVDEKATEIDELQQNVVKEHDRFEDTQRECERLNARISEIGELRQQLAQERERVSTLSTELSDVLAARSELEGEVGERQQKEGEMLSFHQRMAAMNAELQSQHTKLSDDVLALRTVSTDLRLERDRVIEERNRLRRELETLQKQYNTEVSSLSVKVDDKTKAVEQLTVLLEDERGEVRVLKKKNAASVKDLTRQLLQARKTVDGLKHGDLDLDDLRHQAGSGAGSRGASGMSSYGSDHDLVSCSSGTEISVGGFDDGRHSAPAEMARGARVATRGSSRSRSRSQSLDPGAGPQTPQVAIQRSPSPEKPMVSSGVVTIARPPAVVEKERRMLLNKIGSLQNSHASKDEKLEFLESHISELTEEIKRKTKVIQCLVLRQDSGSISPASLDSYKLQAGPQRGIMASVFHSRKADQKMTLALSLEITSKMQAVLEDLLVKNMTLKDNLATLGQEVADLLTVLKQHNIRVPRKMR